MDKLAQTVTPLGNVVGEGSLGRICHRFGLLDVCTPLVAPYVFSRIISNTVGLLTIIAGVYFLFLLITGAISWMSAGGDKGAVETAKKRIQNGLIGLVIIISAVFILRVIEMLIGSTFLTKPELFIYNISL